MFCFLQVLILNLRVFYEIIYKFVEYNILIEVRCCFLNFRLKCFIMQEVNYFVIGFKVLVSNNVKDYSMSYFVYILDFIC